MLEPSGFFPIRKSQDAAVGALVRMLQKAPPLRQDFTNSSPNLSRPPTPGSSSSRNIQQQGTQICETIAPSKGRYAASSSITASKTTGDALEELESYREMKNLLLRQWSHIMLCAYLNHTFITCTVINDHITNRLCK